MQTNIFLKYLSERIKKNNLLRRLSDIVSFMLLQNKYNKCDYCLLLLSLFSVVCDLFLLFKSPLTMTLSLKRVRLRVVRVARNIHYTQGWCVVYSSLVLSWLLLCCLFSIFLFLFLSSSI
jgi:hypothetical protein